MSRRRAAGRRGIGWPTPRRGAAFLFCWAGALLRLKRFAVPCGNHQEWRPRTSHSHARPSHCTATEHGFILTRLDTELDTSVK